MEVLHANSHLFVLPAARVHIVSLLQAMAAGLAVVASDGWGIEEHIHRPRTQRLDREGAVMARPRGPTRRPGCSAKITFPTYTPDPEVVNGLVEAVSRLVEDHELRRRRATQPAATWRRRIVWNAGTAASRRCSTAPLGRIRPGRARHRLLPDNDLRWPFLFKSVRTSQRPSSKSSVLEEGLEPSRGLRPFGFSYHFGFRRP